MWWLATPLTTALYTHSTELRKESWLCPFGTWEDEGPRLPWWGFRKGPVLSWSDTLPPAPTPGLCTPLGLRKQLHMKAFISLHFHWESCRSLGKAFGQLFECWGFNVILKNNGNLWKHSTEPSGVSKACRFCWDNHKALENPAPPPTHNAGHHGHATATWRYTLSLRDYPSTQSSKSKYYSLSLPDEITDHQQLGLTNME